MATVTDLNQLLDLDVVLDLHCLDRIYLNAYIPTLPVGGQVTYVPTMAGFLFVAVVLDTFSRRVVGWAMAPRPTART
jgi:transposase InsO family protein